jgi:hypothetical protein
MFGDKSQFTVHSYVTLKSSDINDPRPIGIVCEPKPADLAYGEEDMGSDIEFCILIAWPTAMEWEYPEDLQLLPNYKKGT